MQKLVWETRYFFRLNLKKKEKNTGFQNLSCPKKVKGYYLRVWVFKKVFIISTNNGFEIVKKSRNNFKIVFGISGINLI